MRRRAKNGFTLLELLLAVSLLSLITASIMGGIHLGRRSWESTRASDALDEVESAVRATTGLLSRAFVVAADPNAQNLQGPPPAFSGAADGCRFVFLSEGGAQWGGLIVTEIGVDSGPEGQALAVWTKPYRPLEGLSVPRATMKKTIVAEGLQSIAFGYYGAPEPAQGQLQPQAAIWSGSWKSVASLPALVSVKIVLRRLGRDLVASSVVALRQQ